MKKITHSLVVLIAVLLSTINTVNGQSVNWLVQSPLPNSTVSSEDLFISLRINDEFHYGQEEQIRVFLNNKMISGNMKVMGNTLHMLYTGPLRSGKNTIKIETYIVELNSFQQTEWSFLVGSPKTTRYYNAQDSTNGNYDLTGVVTMDYRKQFLSGPGQSLRQEPLYTSTMLVDAVARYKNATMPVRVFMTSNNKDAQQRMNYFSVGFRNTWLETDLGDMNPTFDELVLSGARVRGGRLMLKYKAGSIQVISGQMNNRIEGEIRSYVPGMGYNGSLLNDSQYVTPGVYKRTMSAARIQYGVADSKFKMGITAFRAKDDTTSIRYGLLPKHNIAGGVDMGARFFRKTVGLSAGAAMSVLTNDISNGALDKDKLDPKYNIDLPFNPKDYEKIMIINASTVPESLGSGNSLAYFGRVTFNNKFQNLSIEYKNNGGQYYSLGNPFLRNNYRGILASERFFILKRKVFLGLVYQNYSNNLNNTLPAKVYTQVYRGDVYVNWDKKWPTLYLNYMRQNRNGKSGFENIVGVDDRLNNYLVNIGLSRDFWNIDHFFFVNLNIFDRKDRVRIENHIISYTGTVGINETFNDNYNMNADLGKTMVFDANGERIVDVLVYSLGFNWLVKPEKYSASAILSNNQTYATMLSNESYRLSAILRFNWTFWRGMNLMLEGGYQPFRDKGLSTNNYDDSYIYIRYSSDLNQLLSR